jgi:hypothetical protein
MLSLNSDLLKKSKTRIVQVSNFHRLSNKHEWRYPLLDLPTTLISRNAEQLNKIPTDY